MLQIKIFDGNIVDPKNADMDSLIPASPFEKEELVSKLKSFLTSIENEKLKKIVYDVLGVYKEKFLFLQVFFSGRERLFPLISPILQVHRLPEDRKTGSTAIIHWKIYTVQATMHPGCIRIRIRLL